MAKIVRNRKASKREKTAAARAIISMEAQNQADEHKELPYLYQVEAEITASGGGVVLYIPDNGRNG